MLLNKKADLTFDIYLFISSLKVWQRKSFMSSPYFQKPVLCFSSFWEYQLVYPSVYLN